MSVIAFQRYIPGNTNVIPKPIAMSRPPSLRVTKKFRPIIPRRMRNGPTTFAAYCEKNFCSSSAENTPLYISISWE